MKRVASACLVVVGACCAFGCRAELGDADAPALARVTPSGLSSTSAWRLFDRSVASTFTPTNNVVRVAFDREEQLSAIKVYGGAPYRLHVTGFDEIDLSRASAGWHVYPSTEFIGAKNVELRFEAIGAGGAIPELELWAVADDATDPSELRFDAAIAEGVLTAGDCSSFPVELGVAPSTLRSTKLAYDARGLYRAFEVQRTINGLATQGGRWLAGDPQQHAFAEEIDPATLRLGDNLIQLCLPASATGDVRISNLRITGLPDRGVGLASAIDAAAVTDGDPATSKDVAAGEPIHVAFERLIAPDAVTVVGRIDAATTECVDASGGSRMLAPRRVATSQGASFLVDGGALACASLTFTPMSSATIGELDVIGSGAAEPVDWPRVVVTSPREHFGTTAWVGGFVARPRAMTGAIRTAISGQASSDVTGDFGQLITRSGDTASPWSVLVTARLADASTHTREVVLDLDQRTQLANARAASIQAAAKTPSTPELRFGREGQTVAGAVSPASAATIRLGSRVAAAVPSGAVTSHTQITIKHLGDSDLPALEPGMVNVTAPAGHGYEFLPHGQKFVRKIDVGVPFDASLVPSSMLVEDVHTYYYDPVAARWQLLERTSIDPDEKVIHSATDHFTIMIDAVIAVPKNPAPLSFDPTTLSSIAAASPAANLDLIEPPQASSTGDAHLSLPIRLPAGRGAYTPSLNLGYTSSSGSGWLGVGWDLQLSKIEIDTRWGVPSYADGEAVRYLLDGAELVPSSEPDEGPTCAGGKRFRPRIEGAFAHILRCGSGPADYHWEVRDRDGTLYVYGDTAATRLASYEDLSTHHGIFREAPGHVSPASGASQARFARLFESVGSNRANLRTDAVQAGLITQQAADAGVQAFTWSARTGQVWVTVREGVIQNAGVNLPGAFR